MHAAKTPTHELSCSDVSKLGPISKLVHMVLLIALKDQATEVWFEPQQDSYRLAYRVDGNIYEMIPPPLELASTISQEFKVLGDFNRADRQSEQEGRMRLVVATGTAEVVVSIRPTPHGEAIHVSIETNSTTSDEVRSLLDEYSRRSTKKRSRFWWLRNLWGE